MIADEVLERLPLDQYNLLAALLKEAVVLRIQNVAEYYNRWTDEKEAWSLADDFPYVTPPWPVMWAEFESGSNGFGLASVAWELSEDDRVTLAEEHLSLGQRASDERLSAYRSAKWGVMVTVYEIGNVSEGYDAYLGCVRFGVGLDGRVVEETLLTAESLSTKENLSPVKKSENLSKLVTDLRLALPFGVLLLALSFCHCKNAVVAPQVFPAKLVEKRAKHYRAPITKIHTLDLRPVHRILSAAHTTSSGSLRRALHICRDHFNDCTHGPGLFGRSKALCWWNMNVRGIEAAGELRKDCSVSQEAGA
jgi:hypothetical protein